MSKRVAWVYRHQLNRKSSIVREKVGDYFGKVKHTYKHWQKGSGVQMAVVHFDGNKRVSKVPYSELRFL